MKLIECDGCGGGVSKCGWWSVGGWSVMGKGWWVVGGEWLGYGLVGGEWWVGVCWLLCGRGG